MICGCIFALPPNPAPQGTRRKSGVKGGVKGARLGLFSEQLGKDHIYRLYGATSDIAVTFHLRFRSPK